MAEYIQHWYLEKIKMKEDEDKEYIWQVKRSRITNWDGY